MAYDYKLILDPDNENCIGCAFNADPKCRKPKSKRWSNVSCVGLDSNGRERMGKFKMGRVYGN